MRIQMAPNYWRFIGWRFDEKMVCHSGNLDEMYSQSAVSVKNDCHKCTLSRKHAASFNIINATSSSLIL